MDFYGRVAEGSLCTADLCGTDCQCQAACDCLDTDGGITPDQFYIFGWAEYCNDDRTRLTDYCVGTESTCDTCETPCNVVEDCALYDGHPDYENFAGTDTCNACNVERNQCDTCPATCETEADCVDPDGDGTAELDGCHCIDSVCRSCPFYSFVYCPKVGDGLYYDVLSFDWEDCETDQDTMKCCNEKSDCVDETGYCRRVGSTVDTDSDLEFEVCYAGAGMPGGWVDADKSPLLCDQLDEHILGKNKGWLDCTPGDECVEGVNDYLSDDGMKFTYGLCCGDDASENLVESRIYDAIGQVGSTLYQGCCENAGACVDSQGSCHEEGSGGICFQEGVQMVCHAGNWVLEPNADCPGCSECDITGEGGVKDGQITLADMNLLGTIIEEALSTGDYDEAYDMDLDGDNDWDDWNYCNSMFGDSCSTCPDGFVQPNEECESVNTSKCEDYICADGRKKVLAGCSDLTCSCVYEDTGSCDADCGASCESNADCPADSCEETFDDFCQGSMLVDYDNNNRLDQDSITITNYADNICTQGCACTDNTAACAPPAIAPRCVSGVCGASCSSDADCGAGFDQQRCLEENKGSGSLSDVVVAVEGQAGFAAIGDSWCCGEQGEYYVRNYGSLTLRTPSLPGQGPYAFSFAFRLPDAAQPIEYLEIVCGSGPSERTYEISGTELESIAASQDNPNGFTWYTPLECSFSQGHNEVHVYSESMTTVHLTAMRIQGSGGTCNGCQCSFD